MKKIFKTAIIAISLITAFAATELRAQDDSNIGLTVGLDYVSNYTTRGEQGFGLFWKPIGGFFFPYASFDVFGSGLSVTVRGEITEAYIGSSSEEREFAREYGTKHLNCIDFNVDYMYSIEDVVTFDIGSWYYRYRTVPNSFGYYQGLNFSYFDFYLSAAIDALPLTPTLTVTYSHFTDSAAYRNDYIDENSGDTIRGDGENGDWYFQLGLGHSFELANATYLDLGAVAGYYYKRAMVPKSPDISDIDLSAGISTTKSIVTFTSSFHYIIVPGTQFKYRPDADRTKDVHRFYAKFGASMSI